MLGLSGSLISLPDHGFLTRCWARWGVREEDWVLLLVQHLEPIWTAVTKGFIENQPLLCKGHNSIQRNVYLLHTQYSLLFEMLGGYKDEQR